MIFLGMVRFGLSLEVWIRRIRENDKGRAPLRTTAQEDTRVDSSTKLFPDLQGNFIASYEIFAIQTGV